MTIVRADKLFPGEKGWLVLTGDVPIYRATLKEAKAMVGDSATGYWPAQRVDLERKIGGKCRFDHG